MSDPPHAVKETAESTPDTAFELDGDDAPYKSFSRTREVMFVTVVSLAQLLTQAGLSQGIPAITIIGKSFSVSSAAELSWFAASYSLTVGTFILPAGRWGDLFGHRRVFLIGWVWFGVWSLIAGFSVYSKVLLFHFSRGMQGIGPALMIPNGLALLGQTYPPGPRKNLVFCIFGATAPCGFIIGAAFTSILAEFSWWPWAFWIMGIVCLGVSVGGFFVIPESHKRASRITLADLDPLGSFTGVAGLVLFNVAWNQAPVVSWKTAYTYVLLIIGVLFLVAFFIIEKRFTVYPLVPVSEFNLDTYFVFACVAAGWASFGIWIVYFYQFQELARGYSPLEAVAQHSPAAPMGALAAIVTSKLMGMWRPAYIMLAAMCFFFTGAALMAFVPVHQTYWGQTFVAAAILSWGMDLSFPSSTIILSNSMRKEHQGVAASLINTVVNYSSSLGLGFAGTIDSQINKTGLDYVKGCRGSWYLGIGLAGTGICVASLYSVVDLSRSRHKKVSPS